MHPQSVWLLFGGQAKESAPPSLSLSFFEQNPLLLVFFTVSFLALKLQKMDGSTMCFLLGHLLGSIAIPIEYKNSFTQLVT
jgi:hypothetical protein